MTELEYRKFVQHQRSLCDAHINLKLDELCERAGFNRSAWRTTWRSQAAEVRFVANMQKFFEGLRTATQSLNEFRAQIELPLVKE